MQKRKQKNGMETKSELSLAPQDETYAVIFEKKIIIMFGGRKKK